MQMLAGGALLLVAGLLAGETRDLDPSLFSTRSVLALLYLIVFGALIGYSAYVWLLRVVGAVALITSARIRQRPPVPEGTA